MVSVSSANSNIELYRHRLYGLSFVVNDSKASGDLSLGFSIESKYELIDVIDNTTYSVVVDTGIVAMMGKNEIFRMDIKYLGAFSVEINDQDERIRALEDTCPKELFPYICKKMADITEDADFPPLMMSHIDLEKLYDKQRKGTRS